MRVIDAGEFGLIAKLTGLIEKKSNTKSTAWSKLIIGAGDDTAAWKCRTGIELVTTDILVEDIHFDLSYTSWRDLGWKSIAINVSDIYAMGGQPQYALVSLSLPGSCFVSDVLLMYEGMIEACNKYGAALAGGNVSSSEKVTVNITMTGTAGKHLMMRSAAKSGDLIAISGYPGLSNAGLRLLKSDVKLSSYAMHLFRSAHFRPAPPVDYGPRLVKCGVKAAIDTSDGLLSDLGHVCEASKVSAAIYEQDLPVHPQLKKHFQNDYLDLVLSGGEDYQIVFTAGLEVMNKVMINIQPAPKIIGEIFEGRPGNIIILDARGKNIKPEHTGWNHYRGTEGNG